MSNERILLYVERNLHLPFLEPIYDRLVELSDVEPAFSAPSHIPVTADDVGIGLDDATISRLRLKGPFVRDVRAFDPAIIVVADCCYFRLYDGPKFVNVGHGMICKGSYYTNNAMVRRENIADLICTPGQWHKERLQELVFSPIKVTGFIKSDRMYGDACPTRGAFLGMHGIDPRKKIIFFAPTYNNELSMLPCIADHLHGFTAPDRHVLIKLHGMTSLTWKHVCSEAARENPHITLLGDDGYAGAMISADVLVSDVSSSYVEFMGLDKPIVLFNNPQRYAFEAFSKEDIEYLVRDACYQVDSVGELHEALETALEHPGIHSDKRQSYAEMLDYGRDGRATQRVCEAIQGLVGPRIRPEPSERFVVLAYVPAALQGIALKQAINHLRMRTEGDFELILVGPTLQNIGARGKKTRFVNMEQPDWLALAQLVEAKTLDLIGFVVCGAGCLPNRWNTMLKNHFRWNKGTGLVSAVCDPVSEEIVWARFCPEMRQSSPENKARYCKFIIPGESLEMEVERSGCFLCNAELFQGVSEDSLEVTTGWEDIPGHLCWKARHEGLSCRLACDAYIYLE